MELYCAGQASFLLSPTELTNNAPEASHSPGVEDSRPQKPQLGFGEGGRESAEASSRAGAAEVGKRRRTQVPPTSPEPPHVDADAHELLITDMCVGSWGPSRTSAP